MTDILWQILKGVMYLEPILYWGVAMAGLVGIVMLAFTRPDAFFAADRQSKMTWLGLLAAGTVACLIGAQFAFLGIIGVVIVGLYWWDLRPQLRDLLGGQQGGW
ncbi:MULTISPECIES: DUF2516 family protein [unclassified Corynebacterium]|uniref:DUF2516 family protein n=1 Tax=unclassified Corynebacterium TaxID=2624378 RepID=UPI0029C9BB75|nr:MULTISPECIES: DUF2516 family protein [unclassified Corynebacterium]WPF66373.1 DUF2516 family protein [Corynebacterium sp. 22KM0430]WPF68863.1 DUF2516 family protein [Corynebacterium sp. 21KM1197]